jgi:LysR family transcriptional regulator, hca operon transcriptional activator
LAFARPLTFLKLTSTRRESIAGDAPTVDLVVGYNKANTAHVLKLFLERVDFLAARE